MHVLNKSLSVSLFNFVLRNDVKAETPILWPPDVKSWLIWKDPDAGKDWGQEEKGTTEDEMVGWHHRLDGHGFGWTLGAGDGQGGLACCGSWGRRVGHDWATELNWKFTIISEAIIGLYHCYSKWPKILWLRNNLDSLSYSSRPHKSKMGLTGLKSMF